MKQLRDVATPVANFLASGVLALGPKLGPVLWQLPPRMRFDADRIAAFLALLPRTTAAAARLAEEHDERLDGRALTATDADRPLRHAVEPRHESFRDPAFTALLREHGVALVVADSPGTWPVFDETHGGLPLRPPARRRRALRLRLHRRRRWTRGPSGCGRGWPTATCSSTSTTTQGPRAVRRHRARRAPLTTAQLVLDLLQRAPLRLGQVADEVHQPGDAERAVDPEQTGLRDSPTSVSTVSETTKSSPSA